MTCEIGTEAAAAAAVGVAAGLRMVCVCSTLHDDGYGLISGSAGFYLVVGWGHCGSVLDERSS